MPASGEIAKGSNPSGRTTFRPPWVKEGSEAKDPLNPFNLKSVPRKPEKKEESPSSDSSGDGVSNPIAKLRKVAKKESSPKEDDVDDIAIPEKDNPLEGVQLRKVKKKEPYERESFRKEKENNPLANVKLRKTSVQTKEPQQNGEEKESFFVKPQLKPVPQREKTPPKKDHKIHDLPSLKKVEERKLPERKPSLLRKDSTIEEMEIDRVNGKVSKELPAKRNSLVRGESMRRLSQTPAPPPMPPPPPGMPGETLTKPLTAKQQKKIEQLKSRPKVRPDWSATLKEIEGGKKLRHVECNDRSQPLLPEAKAQEHFLYASEKPNVHNELLKQIESGIKLKKVQTNDRSKPILEGLRKFRRQMTIEEQVQKSISMASMPPVSDEIAPEEVDELDDIDKVRDDLQSTKQMLALELRNKEAQEMENKRLLARLANLEAELEKAKSGGGGGKANNAADEKVIQSLKKEAEQSRKNSEQIEKKYTEAVKQLDTTKLQLEESKRKNMELEKKLIDALGGKRVSLSTSRQNSVANGDEDEDLDDEETEEESDGEDTPEKKEKRLQKEVKQLGNKLRNFKNKEDNAKKERIALKEIIKKNQAAIKEEKKKYNKIKKEVDKMASLLKDVADEDEEDEEEKEDTEEEEVEEEESSDEETESESESDDSDSEKSLSEPEDAPLEKKKVNLASRSKRHEARLGALKKGNFLLKTNAERLQDDLNKQKEMTAELQEDLDSVLSELG
ncbi:glutamic acid-rich protein-like isoform X4 [Anthonomus grandis grandis]|uniref:glutamic acid-rich protein-like isoform X4 n=1 Tax=Anthonomus grandis grandis TaxID=2921223 RepID=UPI0021669167|nr:glutamic acid-rich protein-like isoform X4 [Anthonomus grandis grandis]